MTTLPTPEQLVLNGLKFFIDLNRNNKIGKPLAPIYALPKGQLTHPSGICIYIKTHIWWIGLPNYPYLPGQQELVSKGEQLIDKLIEPYLSPHAAFLPEKEILTKQRIRIAIRLINKLEQQNATQSIQ